MTAKEQVEAMEKCTSFDGCSASVCPLDPLGEGCYVPGDKVCPRVLDFLEGTESPLTEIIKTNEPLWRKHLSGKLLDTKLAGRLKFRKYWIDRAAGMPKAMCVETA